MARKYQSSESRRSRKKRRRVGQAPARSTRERTENSRPVDEWVDASHSSIEAQVERLADPRLPVVQRQALVTRIGQAQGNEHLQRVVETLKKRQKGISPSEKDDSHRAEPGQRIPAAGLLLLGRCLVRQILVAELVGANESLVLHIGDLDQREQQQIG